MKKVEVLFDNDDAYWRFIEGLKSMPDGSGITVESPVEIPSTLKGYVDTYFSPPQITPHLPGFCTYCGNDRGPTIICQSCGWADPPTTSNKELAEKIRDNRNKHD